MLEVLLDALIDALKILPFLFIIYFFLELIENNNVLKNKTRKMLNGKGAPLVGTIVGVIPQCGFSVVATKLYCGKLISIGTLIAVYIATSDEALPILLSNPNSFHKILPLLLIKIGFAIVMGYSMNALFKLFFKKDKSGENFALNKEINHNDTLEEMQNKANGDEVSHSHCCEHHHSNKHITNNKDTEKHYKTKRNLMLYGLHPLLHSLKVMVYILIVNLIIGTLIYYIGEERFSAFILKSKYLQPALASLIGLIPNCASSVIITQLYVLDSISLGATVAGLSVNAGLGYAILFKQNKNIKENLFLVISLYVVSVILGTLIMIFA